MRQATILERMATTVLTMLALANIGSSALDSRAACIAGFRYRYLARLR